jgi:tRNA nucleotidyltransferase/poly(A) polymerase
MSRPPLVAVDFAEALRRDPCLRDLSRRAADLAGDLLLVGGAPRDLLLGRSPRDLDFILAASDQDAQVFLENFTRDHQGHLIVLGRGWENERRVVTASGELDFVVIARDGLPAEMSRRDFTMNAIAVRLPSGEVHDPLQGRRDLAAGLLRQAGPETLQEDPLRALRAVRLLAAGVAGRVEPQTRAALCRAAPGLAACAAERIGAELDRIAATRRFGSGLVLMQRWGLLDAVLPMATLLVGVVQNGFHHLDCWRHTVAAVWQVDHLERLAGRLAVPGLDPVPLPTGEDLLVLKYAALCHDLGKPATCTTGEDGRVHFYGHEKVSLDGTDALAERCRFSRRRTRRVRSLVRHHLRPGALGPKPSEKALRRLVNAAGEDLDLLLFLALADTEAARGEALATRQADLESTCRLLRQTCATAGDQLLAPRPLLNGRTVMRLTGLRPGPSLGRVISALVRLQVEGEVTSRRQAEKAVRRLARTAGGASRDPSGDA